MHEKETDKKRSAVQFSCDFTHLPGGKWQLGMVLVKDINHKGWTTPYIITPTENIEFAKKLMEVNVDLINKDLNTKCEKALIDGAHALRNVAISLGVNNRSCITHAARVPNGSLHNLLKDNERLSLKRQLGSSSEVEIDSANRRVTCNCEDYKFHNTCFHQATFEVLQFGVVPNKNCCYT